MKMKKIYSILLGAAVLFSSSIASAQQLPNSNFDGSWVNCVPWTSKNNTSKKGVQPDGWCISHVIGMSGTGATEVGGKYSGGYDGSAYAVKLIHTANPFKSSEIVPGYMSLGTSWATSKGGMIGSPSNKDGGVFGGLAFTYKPDAISFYYQRSHGSSKPSEPASVIVYSWKGQWSQASVPGNNVLTGSAATVTMVDRDKNILGMSTDQGGTVSKSADAELISYLNYSIQGDASSWTYFEQPIPYKTSSTPEKINVIISAGDYFGGSSAVGKDNTLIFDNVSLIYYSRLSALSVNGVAVEGFDSKVYNYSIASTELPTEDQIAATVMGQTATKSIAIDKEAATVTITVSNVSTDNDGQSSHTYVLQYEKAPAKVGVSTTYPGYLNGVIIDTETNENMPFAENEEKAITITEYEDGTCDFLLPDLYLSMLEMSLGDILVEGATVTKDAAGVATYNGVVEAMPLLGGELIADVTLDGTINAEGVVNMTINVLWEGVPIVCTFTSEPVINKVGVSTTYAGYLNGVIIDTETNENMPFAENEEKSITITEYEDGTCDFLLPDLYLSMLEMSLGDILVEGATVTKDEAGVATYNGVVEAMPLLGGELIADVTLNGTISAAGVVEMQIDVLWEGVPIVCTFTTNQVTGVENIEINENVAPVYYNLQGVKVANPENGVFIKVQGCKATKVIM